MHRSTPRPQQTDSYEVPAGIICTVTSLTPWGYSVSTGPIAAGTEATSRQCSITGLLPHRASIADILSTDGLGHGDGDFSWTIVIAKSCGLIVM
jgi:hypothetical protein